MTEDLYETLCKLLEAQFEELLMHARVPARFISTAPAARAVRATEVMRWAGLSDANLEQIEAALKRVVSQDAQAERPELHPWEKEYLRNRVAAWEECSFGAFAQRAKSQFVDRARLYVPLKAVAQPWCYVDREGRLVVTRAEAPGGARARGQGGDPEAAPGGGERERTGAFTEHALSHPELPYVVVQGDAGSGKTVLLQHVAHVLALAHLGQPLPPHEMELDGLRAGAPLLRIPVWVEARAVATSAQGLAGAMPEALRGAFACVEAVDAQTARPTPSATRPSASDGGATKAVGRGTSRRRGRPPERR